MSDAKMACSVGSHVDVQRLAQKGEAEVDGSIAARNLGFNNQQPLFKQQHQST